LALGHPTFYKTEGGKRLYYDLASKSYQAIPGQEKQISLSILKPTNTVFKNDDAHIIDLGDGIVGLEFHSKMNTMGQGVLEGLAYAIETAEKDFRGLVIGNESNEAFSAGANLGMLYMFGMEKKFNEVNQMIATFQESMMRVR